MMTQAEMAELATKYAYDLITCPDSTQDIDRVVEQWLDGKDVEDASIWEPFENKHPRELADIFYSFESAFLNFAKEIKG